MATRSCSGVPGPVRTLPGGPRAMLGLADAPAFGFGLVGIATRTLESPITVTGLLTDPSTAGVLASYASLGDVILAEPKSLVGFAGARVIRQTIGEELPAGFQRAEFVREKGFVDRVVHRKQMRDEVARLLEFFWRSTGGFAAVRPGAARPARPPKETPRAK